MKFNKKYNLWVSKEGLCFKVLNGKLKLKPTIESRGYLRVYYNGKHKAFVHRIVWETFKGDIPDGMVIDHIDTHKDNNRLDNLKMCSQKENMNNTETRKHISESQNCESTKLKMTESLQGKFKTDFGNKFFEHYKIYPHQNRKLYKKEHKYFKNHNVCSWEV